MSDFILERDYDLSQERKVFLSRYSNKDINPYDLSQVRKVFPVDKRILD